MITLKTAIKYIHHKVSEGKIINDEKFNINKLDYRNSIARLNGHFLLHINYFILASNKLLTS